MRYIVNNIQTFFMVVLVVGAFATQVDANSLKYKLKMSGYSDHQIEDILRGHRSFKDVQNDKKSTLIATKSYQPVYAPKKRCTLRKTQKNKRRNPLAARFFRNFLKKRKVSQSNSMPTKTSDEIRQSIKERFLVNKRPPRYELIEHIQHSGANEAHAVNDTFVEVAKPYLNYVEDASYENNIKKSLILAVIKVESGFNHRAVSPKGAQGLMQLMPFTARSLGVTNPFDPMQNIHAGTRYLSECMKKLRNVKLALAAYNAGLTRVSKLCKIPPFRETQNFVKDVLRYEKMFDRMIKDL